VLTTQSHLSSAEICRQNGWQVGTMLRGMAERTEIYVRITAIGERLVLARLCGEQYVEPGRRFRLGLPALVNGNLDEAVWDLHTRDWEAV
jgi:hypothetical protein